MLIPIVIGSLAVLSTYMTRDRQNGFGMKLAFTLIFIFLALRYDYGNDYMNYLDGFNEITSNVKIFLTEMRWEPGWNLLHILFKPFGFFAMVAFMSLATCIIFYRFIRDFVPAQYQWLAMFLYVFDPYLFLVPASAMRQNLGIILFIWGIEFLYRKKIIPYVLLSIAAASIHKSGIVLLPFVVLPFVNVKINKLFASVIFLGFASLFVLGQVVFSLLGGVISIYFTQYAETYTGGASFSTGIGLIFMLFQFGAILYFAGLELNHQDESEDMLDTPVSEELLEYQSSEMQIAGPHTKFMDIGARRILFKLAIITFMFVPLGLQLMMIGRINMFFTPVLIAVYPIILFMSKDRFFKLVFLSTLLFYTLFRFWAFFMSPVWRDKFGTYQTIFSAPQWY